MGEKFTCQVYSKLFTYEGTFVLESVLYVVEVVGGVRGTRINLSHKGEGSDRGSLVTIRKTVISYENGEDLKG